MSCLAAVLPARLVALCAACGVLAWRPSARSERPCDLCGVHNCCLRVPMPCCLGLCPAGGRVPSSALHALPHSGSRWESGTSQIPASPEGCHVALWRAAEVVRTMGTQPSRCLGDFSAFDVNRFYPKTQLSCTSWARHSHCDSADPLTDWLEVCCVFNRTGRGCVMCDVWCGGPQEGE